MTPQDHVGDDPVPHAGAGSQGLSTARLTGLLNTTYAALYQASTPGVRELWAVGDSITANNVTGGVTGNLLSGAAVFNNGNTWIAFALLASKGLYRFGGCAATAGYTPAQILATHVPTVIANATKGAYVVVLAGTNNSSLTQSKADLIATYSALIAAGLRPIACTIPPQGAATVADNTYAYSLNTWVRRYARTHGLICADLYDALVDPSTGAYLTAYDSGDHTHPSSAGAQVIGNTIAAAITANTTSTAVELPATDIATPALHPNPLFQLTSPSTNCGVSQWFTSGSLGTSTVTLATDSAIVGKALTLTRGDTNVDIGGKTVTLVPGNRVQWIARIKVTGSGTGNWSFRLELSDHTNYLVGWQQFIDTGGWQTFTWEFTVPSGMSTNNIYPRMLAQGASGQVVQVAQMAWHDLTAMNAL